MGITINPDAISGALTGGSVPKGMSQLFWDTMNASPEAEKIRATKAQRGVVGDHADADIRQAIDEMIARKWYELPPEKQKEYVDQDKKGSKNAPGSPGYRAEENVTEAEKVGDLNDADFADWNEGAFADLQRVSQEAASGNQAALQRLQELMGSIKDPEIQAYVGDYISQAAQAAPSQQAMDDQRKEYQKYSALTDPTITAEERLMMETARRQQEQDLRSQRGAFANELQGRGMYGSGAELSMNLAQSQESAQRRAMDEMTAQAHAQSRAMDALKGANEAAGNIRESEAQESQFRGTAADKATEFNKTLRDAYDKWVTEEQDRQNTGKVDRGFKLFSGETGVKRDLVANAGSLAGIGLQGTGQKIANRNTDYTTTTGAKNRVTDLELLDKGEQLYRG